MAHTDEPYPVKGTTAKKWRRGRAGLEWIWTQCDLPSDIDDPVGYIDKLEHWDVRIDTGHC